MELNRIEGATAWRGPEIQMSQDGVHVMSDGELAEVAKALEHLEKAGDLDLLGITRENFPLDRFGTFLIQQQATLRSGRGFLLLRGLSRGNFSDDQMARIYFGLGAYLGHPLPQSYLGDVLGHVINISDIEEKPRGYHAGGAQDMHTDSCDIVALLCLRRAKSGGASRIVSVATVHNAILDENPELLKALYGTYIFRRTDIDAKYGAGVTTRPISIFSRESGALSCYLSVTYPRRAVEMGEATMSPLQVEALAAIERIASSPENYFDMSIEQGDIQFLNNRVLLHGRTDYVDFPEMARRRHMMRFWLQVPSWEPMPDSQIMHTKEDHDLWGARRIKNMELPSVYLDGLRKQAARAEESKRRSTVST